MIDITEIVAACITVCVSAITILLIPFLQSKSSAEKLDQLQSWVIIAVEAAEQIYGGGSVAKRKAKKEYVEKFLNEKGFSLDADSLDNMIESAVLNLNLTKKGVE